MWKKDGKRREMGLGSVGSVSLARARELASECRAQVLAGLRAAEVTLALKVIDVGGGVTPYEPITGEDMPAGGSWHMVWAKAGDHANKAKAACSRSVASIKVTEPRSIRASRRCPKCCPR
jgi:hypothetical protein